MSRMVGVIGPNRKTIVLVAKHQRLRAAIRSSLSMVISMVESLMVSWMPRASHSLPKNFSICMTQAAQFVLVKGGACGYGYACGTCYQIKCYGASACFRNVKFTTVTATNLCPPNWSKDSNAGNPPRTHFDMAKPAFMKIAQWKAGIVPIMYRRVPCMRSGGLRFSFQGNGYWLLVYVMNAAGGGDIASMWVKGTRSGWIKMSHNWGASYQAFATLKGQALSFRLTSYTSKETIFAWNVATSNWNVGLTYKSNSNFH
ncbi:expansin-A7-like [Malus sylvestris]|uniref:expansin-A7-like n=1 Tax=Malus sylvestris TaxID=3752 RepID=UPI0021ABEFDA|nr:expansin-A7-like [Malus sylvestris]